MCELDKAQTSLLFSKLIKLSHSLELLRECDVIDAITIPSIVLIGTPNSGKTSVLESIVGIDLLPKGEDAPTRRPLELRLCHITEGEPWAQFRERKSVKYTDFTKLKEMIALLTNEICQNNHNIYDKPIDLTIYSQAYPDLMIIDLPGVMRVPIGNQPKNIEEITINMAKRYCRVDSATILCVMDPSFGIATNRIFQLTKDFDAKFERTIGVLTKLDLMSQGNEAKAVLMGEEVALKLGYVGVKNRNASDAISLREALAKEKEFFETHSVYKEMPPGYCGIEALMQKLAKVLLSSIEERFDGLNKCVSAFLIKNEEELALLGEEIPLNDADKRSFLMNMIEEYSKIAGNALKGSDKIKALFKSFLEEFTGDYKASAAFTDDEVNAAFDYQAQDSLSDLFHPQLVKMQKLTDESFVNIFKHILLLLLKTIESTFKRFPQIAVEIEGFVIEFLNEEKARVKSLVDTFVNIEISSFCIIDPYYMGNLTFLLQPNRSKGLHIEEKRKCIEASFKHIVDRLRDSIPKVIGFNMVQSIQKKLLMNLSKRLNEHKSIVDSLNEPDEAKASRIRLKKCNELIREARAIISSQLKISIDDSDLARTSH